MDKYQYAISKAKLILKIYSQTLKYHPYRDRKLFEQSKPFINSQDSFSTPNKILDRAKVPSSIRLNYSRLTNVG